MDIKELRNIRKLRKMSIGDVVKITGINRDRISLVERGVVNPSYDTVEKIAAAIGAKIVLTIEVI